MSQTVQGVIARKKGEPVEVVEVIIPDPGPGEVVVDVIACGVCHTDLTYREGGINDAFPFLLGHEAAGTVESVGATIATCSSTLCNASLLPTIPSKLCSDRISDSR